MFKDACFMGKAILFYRLFPKTPKTLIYEADFALSFINLS
jgi:hypothetical protein